MRDPPMKSYKKRVLTPEVVQHLMHSVKGPDPICDFCGHEEPIVIYAASRMSTGLQTDCWRWCACQDCEYLIDLNMYEAVVGRIVARMNEITGKSYHIDVIREAAIAAFQTFLDFAIETEEPKKSDA